MSASLIDALRKTSLLEQVRRLYGCFLPSMFMLVLAIVGTKIYRVVENVLPRLRMAEFSENPFQSSLSEYANVAPSVLWWLLACFVFGCLEVLFVALAGYVIASTLRQYQHPDRLVFVFGELLIIAVAVLALWSFLWSDKLAGAIELVEAADRRLHHDSLPWLAALLYGGYACLALLSICFGALLGPVATNDNHRAMVLRVRVEHSRLLLYAVVALTISGTIVMGEVILLPAAWMEPTDAKDLQSLSANIGGWCGAAGTAYILVAYIPFLLLLRSKIRECAWQEDDSYAGVQKWLDLHGLQSDGWSQARIAVATLSPFLFGGPLAGLLSFARTLGQ